MRLVNPGSTFKAQRLLDERFAKAHDLDAIYRMMDKVFPAIGMIKTKTFQRAQQLIPETIDILFFDCTTLYFESTETDDLRRFGYSKDRRFNTTQVVLTLATTVMDYLWAMNFLKAIRPRWERSWLVLNHGKSSSILARFVLLQTVR